MPQQVVDRLNAALEGRYRVESEIGEGGMATVYLADDLRHERKVALKVLKPELAAVVGADRFLAEIKTTANLQHPHILPLFDSGEADSFLYYVMPYIEGETLADRLQRDRQLPIDEALGIATAVANALQVAHEAGIVHRDIKPGNILLSRGEPLVADFGIALAVGSAGGSRLTETGLSVGTPYYMSPEQATGDQAIGPASDTFALACVLYEMLVGEPPYPGTTAQAVLGKIIQGVPVSATAVRRSIPLHVDAAIRRALEKIPADRFTNAQGFAKALADPSFRHGADVGGASAVVGGRWKAGAIAATVVAVVFAGLFVADAMAPEPEAPVERFSMRPLESQAVDLHFTISGDGNSIVYLMPDGGTNRLFLRRLDNLVPAPIQGSENGVTPAISRDGSEVAFFAAGGLKVAPLMGGVVRNVADSAFCCARWGDDGYLYYSDTRRTIRRVSASGGASEVVTELGGEGDGPHGDFQKIPGEDVAVFTVWGSPYRVEAMRLSTGERKVVVPGVKPFFIRGGYLAFSNTEGQILAAKFDAEAMELAGPAVPLVEGVRVDGSDWPYYAVGEDGSLLYWSGASTAGADATVVRVDREGRVQPVDPDWRFNPGMPEAAVALSPDGRRLAVKITTDAGPDIWVKELDDGPLSRLTFFDGADERPRWSHDGRYIYYNSEQQGVAGHYDLFRQPSDGTGAPELVLDLEASVLEVQITPDEDAYVLRLGGLSNVLNVRDLVNLKVGETETTPIAAEPYDEKAVALSPDGRWVAYESTETGRDEIYVRPYPDAHTGKWQVSASGGINPKWGRTGRELFFVNADGEMVAASYTVETGAFRVTGRTELFALAPLFLDGRTNYVSWDVGLDDQSFYMIQLGAEDDEAVNEFVLVQNWIEEVKARLGGGR